MDDKLHLSYRLTPRLSELLAEWDARIEAEEPLRQQRWTNIALWPAARSGTVAGSTGIEGNPLTAGQVDEVLAGGSLEARASDVREVRNYNRALDLANRAALRDDFEWSQELLRRLNALVIADLEDDERGEYRRGPVTVGGIYTPPEYQRLPGLMTQLVEWLRTEDDSHPLIRAGLTHLNVVAIHPWLNGNGRTARVAGSLMLMRSGVGSPELLNIESEIRADRDRYMTVLQTTHGPTYDPERHSASEWLEYFAAVCVNRLEARNRLFNALPNDAGILFLELEGTAGSESWPIILLAARLAPIRTSRMAELLGLSPMRVRAILATMAREGWLETIGERRGRYYRPGPRLLALPLRTPELMRRLRQDEPTDAPAGEATE